jgi:RNA polymerase sigma factor (TIGR02999 family)
VGRSSESVGVLLTRWKEGDQEALHALIPTVYEELRSLARRYLRGERPDHTMQSVDLVHEAYIRLVDQNPAQTQDRGHFVAIAARLMRQILVDHARRRRASKRGPAQKLQLDEALGLAQTKAVDLIAIDDALTELSKRDAQQGQIVEMRFFGGLTVEEAAEVLGISAATVKRDWSVAKAWLTREVRKNTHGGDEAVGES